MKIAFISPYTELALLVEDISKQMGIRVDVFKGVFEKGAEIIKKLEKQNYEVVISRGATYWSIVNEANIPVVSCEATSFDILHAIDDARKISKDIGLIIHEPIIFDYEFISKVFDINLIYKASYKNSVQLKKMVKKAIEDGAKVIIGGVVTKSYAEELGCRGILLESTSETIRQAINKAIEVANLSRKQKIETERLNHIINFSYEGIMVTDSEGIVTEFNHAAEEIMEIKAEEIKGKKADKFIPSTKLAEVAKKGEPQLGKIQKIKNGTIITNRIPIKVNNEVLGAVATFQDIGKVQDWEVKIRSEIYKKGLVARYKFKDYLGKNEEVKKLILKAKKYSKSDSTVLILGESGTGKEILSQSMHNESMRKGYPFVAVNCSAIPEHLLESELFGYEEGAFTGAKKGGKVGLFELAHKGTIFLDEIGSISQSLQASLLRVLQEREIWKIGSNQVVHIDVRVIAATNENLLEAVENGIFRRDLYYRLNVLNLKTIPLRKRKEDIIEVVKHYLKFSYGIEDIYFDEKTIENIKGYYWPGNVRELQNFAERLVLLKDEISINEIFEEFRSVASTEHKENQDDKAYIKLKKSTLKEMEKEIIEKLYRECGENSTVLAEKLQVSRTTLWKKLKEIK